MKLRHRQAAAALLATGALWAGCALSKTGFHALSLHFTLAESVAAAQQHLVHSSFYPHDVKVKGFFVRVSGHLAAPADSDLPTQVEVTVINEDVDSGLVTYRFKLPSNTI